MCVINSIKKIYFFQKNNKIQNILLFSLFFSAPYIYTSFLFDIWIAILQSLNSIGNCEEVFLIKSIIWGFP